MMSRVIVIFVAVLVFFWLLRRALGSRKQSRRPREPAPGPAAVPDLVSCAHCGVHLPAGEAVTGDDAQRPGETRHYCSDEHRRLGPR